MRQLFGRTFGALLLTAALSHSAAAQVLGTFSWQMQPYCNTAVLTLTTSPSVPGGFALEGVDDQCGATDKASAIGMATPNGAGNYTLNFTVVTAPSAKAVQVSAIISPATGSGTWTDSVGNTGAFAFFGASPGLPPRPTDAAVQFRINTHSSQTVPSGGPSTVTWVGSPEYNVGGGTFNAGTGVYTVPSAGLYLFTYSIGWNIIPAVVDRRCVWINRPGVSFDATTCESPVAGAFQAISGTAVATLQAGAAISVRVSQGSGANQSLFYSGGHFAVTKLR